MHKYLDVNTIKESFAASLGCIPNDPIPNQLLLPFLTVPIPGIATNINKIIAIINSRLDFHNIFYNLFCLLLSLK